jgi:O-antigen/teichoic acid export membrane protein
MNPQVDGSLALNPEATDLNPRRPVLRNTLFLAAAQVLGMPMSILTNAVMARYLGPVAFGYIYIGTTFNAFGFLIVEWGLGGALPALVAVDPSRAGRLLGTSMVWRGLMSVVAYGALDILCRLLGYPPEVRVVVALVFVGYAVSAISNAGQWAILGLERADVAAYRQLLEQTATLLIVAPILLLGGGVNATMVGHAAATVVALVYIGFALRASAIGQLSFDVDALKTLLRRGTPFVATGLVMVLQPTIDAAFLSKLAPAAVVGWHSAARRLIGFLVFPVTSLVGALYPTLCRLQATDQEAFGQTVKSALRTTSLLVVPVALGCALYPDIGIGLFDRASFGPAEDNLRLMSILLFLFYFTMILGVSISAAGRQRAWAVVQSLCVGVSLVLDPLLIPWFQRRTGNGGLGLCVAAIVSEILVLACGIAMAPTGVFDRRFVRSLLPALFSGAAMVAVALALKPVASLLAAPVSVGAYTGSLWLTGGIDKTQIGMLTEFVGRRFRRGVSR